MAVGIVLWAVWRSRRNAAHKRALFATPLNAEHKAILQARVPLGRSLPPGLRRRWEGLVQVFLAEKTFLGCKGITVTEVMRTTVAGHACLLVLGQDGESAYPDLSTIYLYPSTYVRRDEWALDGGLVVRSEGIPFDGESWDRSCVVLSLQAVKEGMREFDGFNVVIHEFAHQFDALEGETNGCPPMRLDLRRRWAPTMKAAYDRLVEADRRGEETCLDPYGAENPAEFFAVLTEAFFELPHDLEIEHPDLFALMIEAFRFDPRVLHPHPPVEFPLGL